MKKIRPFNQCRVPFPRNSIQIPSDFSPFHSDIPLDIEIGCGVGYFSLKYARSNPHRFLISIEKTHTRFKKFKSRLSHHGELSHLLAIHGNAIEWISHFIPDKSVDRYFILYPNPNPKRLNQRWYAMPFMEKIIDTLKEGGEITFATNELFYYREARNYLNQTWGLTCIEDHLVSFSSEPRTLFEKKFLLRGETCFHLLFRKV